MQEALEESVQMMKEAVDDLAATLAEGPALQSMGGMVNSISQAINNMEDGLESNLKDHLWIIRPRWWRRPKLSLSTVHEMVKLSWSSLSDSRIRIVGKNRKPLWLVGKYNIHMHKHAMKTELGLIIEFRIGLVDSSILVD